MKDIFSVEVVVRNEKTFGIYSDGKCLVKNDKELLFLTRDKLNAAIKELDEFINKIK